MIKRINIPELYQRTDQSQGVNLKKSCTTINLYTVYGYDNGVVRVGWNYGRGANFAERHQCRIMLRYLEIFTKYLIHEMVTTPQIHFLFFRVFSTSERQCCR